MNTTNKYIGNLHQDAEISMDLEEGIIRMNYSSLSDDYNSNCIEYNQKLKTDKLFYILYRAISPIPLLFSRTILFDINRLSYKLFPKTYKKHNIQYTYQKILKYLAYSLDGIVTETFEGSLNSTLLVVPIRANLFMEYHLFEDYRDLIKNISLKRRIVQIETLIETRTQQVGWNIVFEFSSPPKQGHVIISSIY